MVEVDTGAVQLYRVPNESAYVTTQIIRKKVRAGSTIITDCGGAFTQLNDVLDEECKEEQIYEHQTCNHNGQCTDDGCLFLETSFLLQILEKKNCGFNFQNLKHF